MDSLNHPLVFGQRMQVLRIRRGMSRTVFAGLLGMSASWVKQIENGTLHTPALPMILRIAEVLRVRDLSELTDETTLLGVPPASWGPEHRTHWRISLGPDRYLTDTNHLARALRQAVDEALGPAPDGRRPPRARRALPEGALTGCQTLRANRASAAPTSAGRAITVRRRRRSR
ncbi:helix-turn-helix domain-containing protein [Streptomyces violaceusniger]|uniref:helix-turn-helix domain-containing protein n=1 Tax=Streptomyces violaceusniger TaxID=68280 RepID=UPI00382797DF